MKKWVYWILIILAFFAAPAQRYSLNRIEPAETLRVSRIDGGYLLQTDTGTSGRGKSIQDAVHEMHDTSSGEVFLNTVDYLILSEGCKSTLFPLKDYLRAGTQVCCVRGSSDLNDISAYLRIHNPGTTILEAVYDGKELSILWAGEKMEFERSK